MRFGMIHALATLCPLWVCATEPPALRAADAGSQTVAKADASGTARPRLSRADLARLSKLDRAGVFAVLGSFDERGLEEGEFTLRTLDLLDERRIPGLAEARRAADPVKASEAVWQACRAGRSTSGKIAIAPDVVATADDALQHRFSFYGEKHELPADINWDFNPGTAHWGHDLNRFSFLKPLTQTYLTTSDPRYSHKAVELILDWIAKCDLDRCFAGSSYVWGSYLNTAIHCELWCETLASLVAHDQVTPSELIRVLKSLHDQLAYLEIVTNGHSGNWPTIGLQAILHCLGIFPVLRDRDRLADYCATAMGRQVAEQVLPDGVQDELTPHYHRVVVGNLLNAARWLRVLGRDLDPQTRQILAQMMHYVQQTAVPDGSKQVAFSDSDPGTPGNYVQHAIDLGLGDLVSSPAQLGPEVFPYAGVALLRQRQDLGDLYLAFDAGPYGRAHQHEDKLGFWLFAYGRNFLVDPGRHLYDTSARSYYRYLRSTAAHSTILVDGQGQHSAAHRETWIAKQPLDLGWRVTDDEVRAAGQYDLGYGPDNAIAVTHRREVVFVRQRCWVVFDTVAGAGERQIESRFQFAPGKLHASGATAWTTFDDANLLLVASPTAPFADVRIECGQEDPRRGWYSDSYNKIEPAPALSLSLRTTLPWRSATLLYPYRGAARPAVRFAFDGGEAVVASEELGEIRVASCEP